MTIPFDLQTFVIAAAVVAASYVIFGISAFRATLSNMVIFSVSIRALVFTASGLMLADRLVGFAVLVPFALAGLWLGNRVHGRISREAVLRVVSALLLLIGVSLLVRAAT